MTVTPNPTIDVNPSKESVAAFAAMTDDSPIGMLNLLRFADGDGAVAYRRYTDVAAGCVGRVGGSAIFMGSVTESDEPWDVAILVYYPRRAAFVAMQNDPAYIGAIPDRTEGLAARLLYPFVLPEMSGEAMGERSPAGAPLAIQLRRGVEPGVASENAIFQLAAGGPGLVSDGRWDELIVTAAEIEPPSTVEATMTLVVSQ